MTALPPAITPPARLRASRDVRSVFAARDVRHGDLVVVHRRDRGDDGQGRVAVVAGRKVGPAVARNRAKRRLRAAAAEVGTPAGTDVVLVARPATVSGDYDALRTELRRLVTAPRRTSAR